MPSVDMVSHSAMLTSHGWAQAENLIGNQLLIGIDRRGGYASREVQVLRGEGASEAVYIGTDSMFGAFAPKTKLVTRRGVSVTAESVAKDGTVGGLWFERANEAPEEVFQLYSAEHIWRSLLSASSHSSTSALAIRARRELLQDGDPDGDEVVEIVRSGAQDFCVVRREALDSSIDTPLQSVILKVVERSLRRDDDIDELERCFCALLMWYLWAVRETGLAYSISYDSMQHTMFCSVELRDGQQNPLSRGRCACIGNDKHQTISLSWSSNGWRPIVSGFLVDA